MSSLPFLKKVLSFLVSGLLTCTLVSSYAFGAIADDRGSEDAVANGDPRDGDGERGADVVSSPSAMSASSNGALGGSLAQDEDEGEKGENCLAKDDEADAIGVNDLADDVEENGAAQSPIKTGAYVIKPASPSLRVLDVAGGSFDDRTNIQLWESNMTSA